MTSSTASTAHMIDHPAERMSHGLASTVEGVLWTYGPLRQSNSTVAVSAEGGVVTLSGNVLSSTMKNIAGRLVMDMPEVTSVVNELNADPDVERAVAMAVALDPDTRLYTDTLELMCLRGTVYLGGLVRAPELQQAEAVLARAVELAAGVEGVRGVLNSAEAAVGVAEEVDIAPAAPAEGAEEASAAEKLAMDERLAIWRERLAAKA